MTDRSFIRANDESRERLARLIGALTTAQLSVDLGEGWTVASALAHTGFWDRWQAERWTEILAGSWAGDDASVETAENLANEALHPYWAGVSAADIGPLALEAASRLDGLIAQAPDEVVDSIEGGPTAYLLHRHRHRRDHIDHIERVLAAASADGAAAPLDRSFVDRNAASGQRLVATASHLDPSALSLKAEDGGWTVAQVLGHLGFWDRFLAARWRAAVAAGPGTQPATLPDELPGLLNEALAPAWAALADAGDAAFDEAVAAAAEVDRILADLPEATLVTALGAGRTPVDRSIHRTQHLETIGRALADHKRR
jgi:hypothetical protein